MNCKANQICRILSGRSANRLVTTLQPCSCFEAQWTCEALQSLECEDGFVVQKGEQLCIKDSNLIPLGDEGLDEVDEQVKMDPVAA